ncbi:MAG: hypothetical protein JST00_45620 [Deltaproteobacteria bacterium]|nr:hypothetical protein [Deltaproteobacteria bacterium]
MPHASVLVRNLLVLRADARSGVLNVRPDTGASGAAPRSSPSVAPCRLYLRRGTLVFADDDGSRTGAGFAKRLVREGLLDAPKVAQITQLAQGAPGRNPSLRFGEVAVEIGMLRSDLMRANLAKEVRATAVRALSRKEVAWELDEDAHALSGIVDFPMEVEALCLEAVRWMDDEGKNAYGLGGALDRKIKLEPGTGAAVARRFELSSDEASFLLRLDGTRTVRELLAAKDTTIDAHALLTALVATRAVQADGGTFSGQMKAATPASSMGSGRPPLSRPVTRPSGSMPGVRTTPVPISSGRISAAPASTPQPGSARPGSVPASRSSGSMPVSRSSGSMQAARPSDVKRALEAQKRSATRSATEEEKRLARLTAKDAVARARTRGWASSASDLQRASELDPEDLELKVYAKYATLRASNEPPHVVDRTELRRVALLAVKTNEDFAFGYVAAAEMMIDDGEHEPAHRSLVRALKLDPTQPDALRLMRIVERRIAERRR